jgi:hypothetical protein
MKILHLTALDGSEWLIPLSLVLDSRRAYYGRDLKASDGMLTDWAQNNMDWSDVKEQAVMVKAMDPEDMADSWVNGKMRVIERNEAPREAGGAIVENYECRRCGKHYSTDQAPLKCDLGPCPMDLASITVVAPNAEVSLADQHAPSAALLGLMDTALEAQSSPAMLAGTEAARTEQLAGVTLTQEQVDALALTVKIGEVMTQKDYIDLFYAMRENAATILAGVEPGDHSDAILAAFGERAARVAIYKAAGIQ